MEIPESETWGKSMIIKRQNTLPGQERQSIQAVMDRISASFFLRTVGLTLPKIYYDIR